MLQVEKLKKQYESADGTPGGGVFGIDFEGHPHLVPLLLPEDMTDHFPLRKDSPLAETAEWQGDVLEEEGAGGSSGKRTS